jgi:outer membrane protein TolC
MPAALRGAPALVLLLTAALAPSPAGAQDVLARPALPGRSAGRADTVTLSLAEAVDRARRTSDEVRLAEAQVEVSEAQLTTARASALPQLRINSGYTHVLENARAAIVGSVFGQNYTYTSNANLSWQVFQGGRAASAWRAANQLRASARFDAREAREALTLQVQAAYLRVLVARRLADLQVRNLVLSTERVTQAEQQQAAGRAARYDVLRVRVERANLEPLALQAANDAEFALLELKRLLNLPIDQPVRLTTEVQSGDVEIFARQASLVDSIESPDRATIRAAELERDARRMGIRVARADLLPTVTLFAQTGFLALPGSGGFPTATGATQVEVIPCRFTPLDPSIPCTRNVQNNGWFADRSVGVQVQWALFDGLRAKGNIDLAQAQLRVAELTLRQERERVAIDVARARAELSRARAAYEAQRQNATEADEAFRLASLRQTRGLGTQLEVSDAQLALLTAQSNAARATYDYYLAAAGLSFSLGRPIPLPASAAAPARLSAAPAGRPEAPRAAGASTPAPRFDP